MSHRLLLLLGLLALSGCRFSDRHAGTSHETETGNSIAGVLQTADGAPAAGILVHLRTAGYARPELGTAKRGNAVEWADSVQSDGKGAFLFKLKAKDTGSLVLEALVADSSLGIRVPIEQSLPMPRDLGPRILGPTGSLQGEIAWTREEGGWLLAQLLGSSRYQILDSTRTTFAFGNLPAGTYAGRAIGYRPSRGPVHFQAEVEAGTTTVTPALVLDKSTAALRGTVHMPPGTRGIAEVEAVGTGRRTRTDSLGNFLLAGLPGGEITLRAHGAVPKRDTVEAMATAVAGEIGTLTDLRLRRLSVLVVDGVNNHDWVSLSRAFRSILGATALFQVEFSTTPPAVSDSAAWAAWKPDFHAHDAVLLNYSDVKDSRGAGWPAAVREDLRRFVAEGGGLVVTQSGQSAFLEWREFREMLGLAWGKEELYPGAWLDSAMVLRTIPVGLDSSHTVQGAFLIRSTGATHALLEDMPAAWLHADEGVDVGLRGPGQGMTILHALAHPVSGKWQPVDWTVAYGRGRVYNTALGNLVEGGPDTAVRCAGFQTMLARGAEWAASGKVSLAIPPDFPKDTAVSLRPPAPLP